MAVTQYQIFCRYLNETVNHTLTNRTTIEWISAEEMKALNDFYEANKEEYADIIKMLTENNYAYTKDPSLYASVQNTVLRENQLSVQQLNIYTQGKRYDEVQDKIEKGKMTVEYCILEPADSLGGTKKEGNKEVPADTNGTMAKAKAERDLALYQYVINEAKATNPKYDMVFMYDGIAYAESRLVKSGKPQADYNPDPEDNAKQVPYVYYERMKRIQLDPWFLFSTHASLTAAMTKAKELVSLLGKDAVKIGKIVPLDQYIEIV